MGKTTSRIVLLAIVAVFVETLDVRSSEGQACTAPTLADCRAPTLWQAAATKAAPLDACAVQKRQACGPLLQADFNRQYAAKGAAATDVFKVNAPELRTNLVKGHRQGYDKSRVAVVGNSDASMSGSYMRSRIGGRAGPPPQATWEANGARLATCAEYAYEEFYDYSKFLDAAIACAGSAECVFNQAFVGKATAGAPTNAPPQIANRNLVRKDGSAIPAKFPALTGTFPKNAFFALPADIVKSVLAPPAGATQATKDKLAAIAAAYDRGRAYYSIGKGGFANEWQFHDALHTLTAGSTQAEVDAAAARLIKMRTAIQDYYAWMKAMSQKVSNQTTSAAPTTFGIGGDSFLGTQVMQTQMGAARSAMIAAGGNTAQKLQQAESGAAQTVRQAGGAPPAQRGPQAAIDLANLLLQEWDLGASGCLNIPREPLPIGKPATPTPGYQCDWSPRMFAGRMMTVLQAPREEALTRCRLLAGDTIALYNPAAAANDARLATSTAFDAYLAAREAYYLAQKAALGTVPTLPQPNPVAPLVGGTLPGPAPGAAGPLDSPASERGSRRTASHWLGDKDWFAAGLEYDTGWGVLPNDFTTDGKVCQVRGTAWAKFHTGVYIPAAVGYVVDALSFSMTATDAINRLKNIFDFEARLVANDAKSGKADFHAHLTAYGDSVWTPIDKKGVPLNQELYNQVDGPFVKKGLEVSKSIEVFGVPLTFAAWAEAHYGFKINSKTIHETGCLANNKQFEIRADLFASGDVYGIATAGIGVPGFQVGVKGQILIIHGDLPSFAAAGFYLEGGTLKFKTDTRADLNLNELDGKIAAFLQALTSTVEYELFSWDGFSQQIPLWKTGKSIDLIAFNR
jgi:hypothetical protein